VPEKRQPKSGPNGGQSHSSSPTVYGGAFVGVSTPFEKPEKTGKTKKSNRKSKDNRPKTPQGNSKIPAMEKLATQ